MFKRPAILLAFICLALFAFGGCGTGNNNGGTSGLASAGTPTTPPPTPSPSPFQITDITMAVSPSSIAGMACGTSINVIYTATFHAPANSSGGTVQFLYTVNNGRGSPSASITFAPGETVKTYSFNWSGPLPSDHVYPGLGGVITTSPNAITSSLIKPTGTCTSSAFQVTGVNLAVSPTSIAGRACGTQITLTYTATFHIAAGGPGGTIQFAYTTNNGRSQTNASTVVSPGQTTKTFTFTSSGTLLADHTFPGNAIVMVTSPNNLISAGAKPSGQCS
jgi:hypothetical protein